MASKDIKPMSFNEVEKSNSSYLVYEDNIEIKNTNNNQTSKKEIIRNSVNFSVYTDNEDQNKCPSQVYSNSNVKNEDNGFKKEIKMCPNNKHSCKDENIISENKSPSKEIENVSYIF